MITFGFWLTNKSGFYKSLGAGFLIVGILGGTISAQNFTYSSSKINKEGTEIWSEERLSRLRKEGKPVFVDVTAKWCITCIANETAVLYTDQMLEEFRRRDVTYLVADWTTYEPNIAKFIEEHGRTGIPLYLFYPAGSSNPPIMLPQILTFSKVLAVLDSEDRRR